MRWLMRIVFASIAAAFLLVAIGIVVLYSRPRPSAESIASAEKRYNEVRALYSGSTTGSLETAIPTPAPAAPSTTETLQARCDRLYLELLIPADLMYGADYRLLAPKLPAARELAGLYDTGVRVSDEAKRHFKLVHATALFTHSNAILFDMSPSAHALAGLYNQSWGFAESDSSMRAKNLQQLMTTLKFLRMVDCPGPYQSSQALYALSRRTMYVEPLPPELQTLDLNLVAPHRALDYRQLVLLNLDYAHDQRAYWESMMKPAVVFQRVHQYEFRTEHGDWFIKFSKYASCTAAAVFMPPFVNSKNLDFALKREKALQEYAAASAKSPTIPSVDYFLGILENDAQLQSRLIAGAIGLRRGDAIPPLDQIGPDSYFYDPVVQKPYKMYRERNVRSSDPQSNTYLYIRRPYVVETGAIQEYDIIRIPLAADHPGLENVPGLK